MKKRILVLLLTLALAVAMVIPMAMPVGAVSPPYPGYTLLETVSVPAANTTSNGPIVLSTNILATGVQYKIEVSGTFFAGGNTLTDIEADAEYSQDDAQAAMIPPVWTDSVHNYESYGEELLDLMVNGLDTNLGAFNADHVYTMNLVGTGSKVSFQIYDIYAQNNSGSLTVKIYEAYGLNGLLAPYSASKAYKINSSIPLKWQYTNAEGNVIDSADADPLVQIWLATAGGGDLDGTIEINDPGASGLRYDATTMTWQFNWQTKGLTAGTYNIYITERNSGQKQGPFPIQLR